MSTPPVAGANGKAANSAEVSVSFTEVLQLSRPERWLLLNVLEFT